MSNIQVNFGDILSETSKSSALWDMGVDSHLKWMLLFSPNVNWDGTSLVYIVARETAPLSQRIELFMSSVSSHRAESSIM